MTEALCPSCLNWRQAEEERFCGLCGASMVELQFVSPRPFTYAEDLANQQEEQANKLVFELLAPRDTSSLQAHVALEIDQTRQILDRFLPRDLLDHGDSSAALSFDLSDIAADGPVTGRLVERTADGRSIGTLASFGFNLPKPRLGLDQSVFELKEEDLKRGTVRLRLTCEDGLVAPIERVDFVSDGAEHELTPRLVADLETMLVPGDSCSIEIGISRRFANLLRNEPRGEKRVLRVLLRGERNARVIASPLFRLARPPRPVFDMPTTIEALAGADLCLPVVIENKGSAPVEPRKVALRLSTAEDGTEGSLLIEQSVEKPIEGGQRYQCLLDARIERPACHILSEPGNHKACLELYCRDQVEGPLRHEISLNVRPERELEHLIAIDFGTTESAAALFVGGPHQSPECIQIGDEGSFVPTLVAYRLIDGEAMTCEVGSAAREIAMDAAGHGIRFFDNIKWQLANPEHLELPDGEITDWTRVAADYIREIKRRIEGNYRVATRVTRSYVTRPARFDGRAIGALLSAFRQAGIEPLLLPTRGSSPATISESWPPSILSLSRTNLDALRQQSIDRTDSIFGEDPTGKAHTLLTIDVGGGSSDFSLFKIDYRDHANIDIHEVLFDGRHDIAGNNISEWIYNSILRQGLIESVSDQGLDRVDFSVHFSWKAASERNIDRRSERNGLAIADAVFAIQRDIGPFRSLLSRLAEADEKVGSTASEPNQAPGTDPKRPGSELFSDRPESDSEKWQVLDRAWQEIAYVPEPLTLETDSELSIDINWRREGLEVDFTAALEEFSERFYLPVRRILERFAGACGAPDRGGPPLQVLVTGRGSLFPLLYELLHSTVLQVFSDHRPIVRRVSSQMSKPITSMGACYIADFVLRDPGLQFHGLVASCLAVLGPHDTEDPDKRQVLPLSDGDLSPDEGIRFVKKEELPGKGLRLIEFVMVGDDETSVDDNRARALRDIKQEVEVPEKGDTYVIVRALDDHRLEIGLAFAIGAVPDRPSESDFASIHWLDIQELPRGW